jgi:hypothetical protein
MCYDVPLKVWSYISATGTAGDTRPSGYNHENYLFLHFISMKQILKINVDKFIMSRLFVLP